MLLKTTDKLFGTQCHLFLFTIIPVIFVLKSYCSFFIINTTNPVITDSHFISVPAKVFNNSLRPAKGSFGIHDPVFLIQGIEQLFYTCCIWQYHFSFHYHLLQCL